MALDPKYLTDGLSTVEGGMDSGKAPVLLQNNQLAYSVNVSLRGGFLKPRARLQKLSLTFPSDIVALRAKSGRFQVAGYYKPDVGPACLLASIGGRQFRYNVATDQSVQEITITYNTQTSANFVPPAIGANVTITVVSTGRLSQGATILVNGKNYTVQTIISPTQVAIKNVDDDGSVNPVPSGSQVVSYDPNPSTIEQAWEVQAEKWWVLRDGQSIPFIYDGASSRRAASNVPVASGREIGPGRMMAYVNGRIWGALTDERSFRAGDLVYSNSGTAAENKRDAVLKETENTFLNGGGDFTTPTSAGGINAMRGMATLDTSLGQGPLQILTPKISFSVNSPIDRTIWQALENPIQTVSNITNGGLSHYGAILVNGDLIYRAMDGIRSLILARRDFKTWGNTPVSREMNRVIERDEETLLKFCSATVFNNRLLITAAPYRTSHGVCHKAWISMDFDLASSLKQKADPIYEGIGVGLNILQIVSGEFKDEERCFMFCLNAEQEIEVYEYTKNDEFDRQEPNGTDIPISWIFETAALKFNSGIHPQPKILKQLSNLELEVNNLKGRVRFKVYWKPDNYPCWILWKEFEECATYKSCDLDPLTGCQDTANYKPQFRPKLSLGEPPEYYDPTNNGRLLTLGYTFQFRFEISGMVEIKDITVKALEKFETHFGSPVESV